MSEYLFKNHWAILLCVHFFDFFVILLTTLPTNIKLNTEVGIMVKYVAVIHIFRKILREWFWRQKRSFYVFARNYSSKKRMILKFCAWTHYLLPNDTQRLKISILAKRVAFSGHNISLDGKNFSFDVRS